MFLQIFMSFIGQRNLKFLELFTKWYTRAAHCQIYYLHLLFLRIFYSVDGLMSPSRWLMWCQKVSTSVPRNTSFDHTLPEIARDTHSECKHVGNLDKIQKNSSFSSWGRPLQRLARNEECCGRTLIDLTEKKKGRHDNCQNKIYRAAVFEAKELRQKTSNLRHLLIHNKGA